LSEYESITIFNFQYSVKRARRMRTMSKFLKEVKPGSTPDEVEPYQDSFTLIIFSYHVTSIRLTVIVIQWSALVLLALVIFLKVPSESKSNHVSVFKYAVVTNVNTYIYIYMSWFFDPLLYLSQILKK
jgi:hypothetical protein